jgi:hypothetical protein
LSSLLPRTLIADGAKDEIRRRNLNVLTPQRAVRFIEKHLGTKGARISTEQLACDGRRRPARFAGRAGF